MQIVLVDSSVWINLFKDNSTSAVSYLSNNINNLGLAICPVIIQEVLQGVSSDKQFRLIESQFNDLIQLIEEPYELAIEAAQLYRNLRKKGITIRKPNDCLIAVYAIKNKVHILHDDIDFVHIAQNSELKLVKL